MLQANKFSHLRNKEFARRILDALTPMEATLLTDRAFCKGRGHNFPILVEVDQSSPEAERKSLLDVNGRQRYYFNFREIGGKTYAISNDWYERGISGRDNRTLVVRWLEAKGLL